MNFRDFLKQGEEMPETPAIPQDAEEQVSFDETPETPEDSDTNTED